MIHVRRFLDLTDPERAALFAFTAERDPDRFTDQEAMARAYRSSAFEHGASQFTYWDGATLLGAMGAVVRDVDARGEAFVTAVAVEPACESGFDALLGACLACIPRRERLVVRMGVSPQHHHLEGWVARHGFELDYDGLIMAQDAGPLPLPPHGRWRLEVVDQANRETYRQVLDEAFRHSPNGASISKEQITELMAEISHADLLGLAYWDGQPAAAYELCLQDESAWIESVAVARSHQGRGLGKWIVGSAVERLREHGASTVKLLVMSSNEPAVRLYKSCGFTIESVLSRWWRLLPNR